MSHRDDFELAGRSRYQMTTKNFETPAGLSSRDDVSVSKAHDHGLLPERAIDFFNPKRACRFGLSYLFAKKYD